MTLIISRESIYFGVCLILLILQIWQYFKIQKLNKEIDKVWDQFSIFIVSISNTIQKLESIINEKDKSK